MSQLSTPAANHEKSPVPDTSSVVVDEVDEGPPASFSKDGGLDGWVTVFGAFWGLFASFGQVNTFGSYQAYYVKHQLINHSPSAISWIGSIQLCALFFSGWFIGRLFDAHGPKHLVFLGTICTTLGLMMTSLCSQYYQFVLSQGILVGLGAGLVFYPCVSSIQTHFTRNRAIASSVAMTGTSAGGIVFPLMLQNLSSRVGFGWAVRASGFVSLFCCLVAVVCCTSRHAPRKPGPFLDVACMKDPKYLMYTLSASIACLGLFVPLIFVAQYAEQTTQSSAARAFDVISALNAGSFLGRPIPGFFADRLGRINLLIFCTAISGILCLAVWLTSRSYTSLLCFAIFYGFFSGGVASLQPPCVAQISPIPQIGMRVGLLYTIISLPTLVSGPIAGAILAKHHGSFDGLVIFAGVCLVLGAAAMTSVKFLLNRDMTGRV